MSDEIPKSIRLDNHMVRIAKLGDCQSDLDFWLKKSPEERLAAVEYLRVMNYGYDPVAGRVKRVINVSDLDEN
jgi:hypothetical protein